MNPLEAAEAFAIRVSAEIEAEADVHIGKILDQVKAKMNVEPGPIGNHWIELGRFNGVHAAIMYLNRKGWLQIPDAEIMAGGE